jgi:MFS family permease
VEKKFDRRFFFYLMGISLLAAGFADFPLLGFHFQKQGLDCRGLNTFTLYLGHGVDAVAALFFGRLYDRIGMRALVFSTLLSCLFAPFAFLSHSLTLIILGIVFWGIGLGAQESIVKAVIANLVPPEKRATAYGIFNALFGLAWFAGSALMGFLYDIKILWLVLFSIFAQLLAILFFFLVQYQAKTKSL